MNEVTQEPQGKRNPGDYSIKQLRELCQSTAPNPAKETHVGLFTRIFSIYSTAILLRFPITPNQISVLGALVYIAGLLVLFSPDYTITLLGPVLYFLSIVLDGSDGEVARFKDMRTKFGGPYVEPVSHDNLYAFTFFLMAIAWFMVTGDEIVLVLGAAASIFKLLYRLMQVRFWAVEYIGTDMMKKEVQNEMAAKRSIFHQIFDFMNRSVYSYTGIFIPFTLAIVFERIDLFIYFYAASHIVLYLLLMGKHMHHIANHQK